MRMSSQLLSKSLLTLVLMLATAIASGTHGASADTGACSANVRCPGNLCCSQYGYCGSTAAYCGAGCLNGPCTANSSTSAPSPKSASPTTADGACNSTKPCAGNLCCSQYNFCGSTAAHCGAGCQSGPCNGTTTSPGPSSSPSDAECHATKVCAGGACCSKYGFCGSTSDYCGVGCQSGPCNTAASPGLSFGKPVPAPAPSTGSGEAPPRVPGFDSPPVGGSAARPPPQTPVSAPTPASLPGSASTIRGAINNSMIAMAVILALSLA